MNAWPLIYTDTYLAVLFHSLIRYSSINQEYVDFFKFMLLCITVTYLRLHIFGLLSNSSLPNPPKIYKNYLEI